MRKGRILKSILLLAAFVMLMTALFSLNVFAATEINSGNIGDYLTLSDTTSEYDGTGKSVSVQLPDGAADDVRIGNTTVIKKDGVVVTEIKDAGEYQFYLLKNVDGDGASAGDFEIPNDVLIGTYTVTPKSIAATITITGTYTYTGSAIVPTVVVKYGDTAIADSEYTVSATNNTNAGTATVTVTDNVGGNYTVSGSTTFTIAPKVVTNAVTVTGTYTYTGLNITPAYTVKDGDTRIDSSEYTVTLSNHLNVGTATVTVTDNPGGNYTVSGSTTFTIAPKVVTNAVTVTGTYTYNGSAITPTYTVKDGDTIIDSSEYTVTLSNNTNAGTATVTVTDEPGGNYTVSGTANFTINKLDIADITDIRLTNVTYTGSALTPGCDIYYNGILIDDACFDLAYTDNVNAGTGKVTITPDATLGGNFTGSKQVTFTIAKAAASISGLTIGNLIYGDAINPTYTYNGDGARTIEYSVKDANSWSTTKPVNVGNYTVRVSAAAGANYEAAAAVTADFKISPFDISTGTTITLVSKQLVYNFMTQSKGIASVTNGSFTLAYDSNGTKDYKVVTYDGQSYDSRHGKNAGTYTITIQGTNNFTGTASTTFTIAQLDLGNDVGASADAVVGPMEVKWNTPSFVFNNANQTITAGKEGVGDVYFTVLDRYTGTGGNRTQILDSSELVLSGATQKAAGVYTVTATATGTGNYKGSFTFEWEIKHDLSSSVNKSEITFDVPTYNGTEVSLENIKVTHEDKVLVLGTDYEIVSGSSATNVENVTLVIRGIGHYTGEISKTWSIIPYDITGKVNITLTNSLSYTGARQFQTISVSEVFAGIPVTYSLYNDYGTQAGDYELHIEGKGNYTGKVSKAWRIGEFDLKDLDITLINPGLIYNATEQEILYTIGQAIAGLDLTLGTDYEVDAATVVKATNAGTYSIIINGKGNYTGTKVQTWTIAPFDISLAGSNTVITLGPGLTYDIHDRDQTQTVTKVTSGIHTLVEFVDFDYKDNSNIVKDAGNYTMTIVGKGNFTGESSIGFSVAKLNLATIADKITVEWVKEFIYNGAEQTLVPRDEEVVKFHYNYTEGGVAKTRKMLTWHLDFSAKATNAGTYTVTANGRSGSYNYTGSFTFEWTIKPFDISLTGSNTQITLGTALTYNFSNQTQTVASVVSGGLTLIEGTDFTVSGNVAAKARTERTLTITGKGNFTGTSTAKWSIAPLDIASADITLSKHVFNRNEQTVSIENFVILPPTDPEQKNRTIKTDDYEIVVGSNKGTNAGTYTLKINGINNLTGTYEVEWVIEQLDISKADNNTILTLVGGLVYNGQTQTEKVQSLVSGGLTLAPTTEYVITAGSDTGLNAVADADFNNVNAGLKTYTIEITGVGNFKGTITKDWFIQRLDIAGSAITLVGGGNSLIYNGKEQTQGITSVIKNTLNVNYSVSGNKATDAVDAADMNKTDAPLKVYTLTVSGLGNFKGTESANWTMQRRTITDSVIKFTDKVLVYNGAEQQREIASVIVEGLKVTYVITPGSDKGTNATESADFTLKDYVIEITGKGNFKDVQTKVWNIQRRDMSDVFVALGEDAIIYNGTEQTRDIIVGKLNGLTIDYAIEGNKGTNAGNYEITLTGIKNFKGSTKIAWTIERLDIAGADFTFSNDLTYNGAEQTKLINTVTKNGLTVTYGNVTGNKGTNAGTYTVSVTGTGNFQGTATCEWVINKYVITNSSVAFTPTNLPLTYNGYDQEFKFTVKTTAGLAVVVGTDFTVEGNIAKNAGNYTVTITGKGNYEGSATTTFDIDKYVINNDSVVIEFTNELIYNGKDQEKTFIVKTTAGLEVIVDVDFTVAGNIGKAAAIDDNGTLKIYTVVITAKDVNYTGSASKDWTIARLDMSNVEVILDGTLIYNGKYQERTYTITQLVEGENVNHSVIGNIGYNAGTNYAFTITGKGNYIGSKTVAWEIEKLDLSGVVITLTNTDFTYNGTAQEILFTLGKVENLILESTDYAVSGNIATNAGDYVLTITGAGKNFKGEATATWTIKRLDMSGATITYGDPIIYNGDYQVRDFILGQVAGLDLVRDVDFVVEGDSGKVATNNNIKYYITVTGTGNFIGSITQEWVIEQKDISGATVTFDTNSFIYNGKEQEFKFTVSDVDGLTPIYSVAGNKATNFGEYDLYIVGGGNFKGMIHIEWYIEQKDISDAEITLGDALEYNGSEQVRDFTAIVDGLEITYTVEGDKATAAGDYVLTITANGNFTGTLTADWSIAKKDISGAEITVDSEHVYNGKEQKVKFTVDLDKSLYTVTGTTATDAGEYVIVITPVDTDNYTGTIEMSWSIAKKSIANAEITLGDKLTYTGAEQTQNVVKVVVDGLEVTFTVSGDKATNVDAYVLTIAANGNFDGERTVKYTVAPDTTVIDGLNIKNVNSTNKAAVEAFVALFATDTAKAEFADEFEAATELLEVINEAADMKATQNITGAAAITSANVNAANKTLINAAIRDLEDVEAGKNFTADEKAAATAEIARLNALLEIIESVADVQDMIDALPDASFVTPADTSAEAKLNEVKTAYNNLPADKKSVIDLTKVEALEAALNNYKVVAGDEEWTKDTNANVTVETNGSSSKLTEVKVDGATVAADKYIVKASGIALKAEYLQTLAAGNHKVTMVYANGSVEFTFAVKDAPVEEENDNTNTNTNTPTTPEEDDNGSAIVWIIAIIGVVGGGAAGTVAAVVVVRKKKSSK